jgi:hypothetical protein
MHHDMRALSLMVALSLSLSMAAPVVAETVRLTMYDDGLACPASCDAHVVFHPRMNGTELAHDPATSVAPFSKCENGKTCTICLESGGKQCLTAMYRGSGPPPNTFDFTPRFYEAACATTPPQAVLATKCDALKEAGAVLDGRQNCIAEPEHPLCRELMAAAVARRSEDRREFQRCRSVGEQKYNEGKATADQRSLDCAYELKGTGGPNSKGRTWRKLLPGACRDGTFVGRDGLDCCSGSAFADGPLGLECRKFYPRKTPATPHTRIERPGHTRLASRARRSAGRSFAGR